MSKLSDKKRCNESPAFAKMQIDRMRSYFSDDKYILNMIDALYESGYKVSESDKLRKALKNKGLL